MTTGVIKKLNERGFGFIKTGEKADLFFHLSGVKFDDLQEGDKVRYEIEQSDKGPRAGSVSRA